MNVLTIFWSIVIGLSIGSSALAQTLDVCNLSSTAYTYSGSALVFPVGVVNIPITGTFESLWSGDSISALGSLGGGSDYQLLVSNGGVQLVPLAVAVLAPQQSIDYTRPFAAGVAAGWLWFGFGFIYRLVQRPVVNYMGD